MHTIWQDLSADEKKIRVRVTIAFFIVCLGGLFFYTYGDPFCARPDGSSHAAQTLRLTVVCTVWQVLVSLCGAVVARKVGIPGLAPMVGTVLALGGFASIPFWIYSSGRFMFEGTWADVSCFFTEGYGMMFPIFVAPLLALVTLAGELIILKASAKEKPEILSLRR